MLTRAGAHINARKQMHAAAQVHARMPMLISTKQIMPTPLATILSGAQLSHTANTLLSNKSVQVTDFKILCCYYYAGILYVNTLIMYKYI